MAETHFTEPTTEYWQEIEDHDRPIPEAPWKFKYPALLLDDKFLYLPIRPLPSSTPDSAPKEAVASLSLTQCSFAVSETLASQLASLIKWKYSSHIDIVIGLPTLGLGIAAAVAKELGHSRYIPLGYSRKFWFKDELSTNLTSITSPDMIKKVYLDPALLPLVKDQRVLIVDDAISSGQTLLAIWNFLESEQLNCRVTSVGVAMKQGSRWKEVLGEERAEKVVGVFDSPLLRAVEGGWVVRE
ncbi:PRTase-like protein [Glarea lozoyensis ATCC 20868]|uniref:PRTase-like protein n=1 Tax=Glarea lozoyensis (strain ATCC 20868 / MF5171) TaxID=1116229 RepID=S3CKY1_GLAL2|nr:PRTase-like protein [Glarea lozoyensis ATCC 20868]EPE25854.1 PRTase-like protein [Glarea lozoyensis ATCC 20868]